MSRVERVESPRESALATYGETYWYGLAKYGRRGFPSFSYEAEVKSRDLAPYGFDLKVAMLSEMTG